MEDSIPSNAISLVKKWEGLHRVNPNDGLVYPYVCPAGIWTIGYGSTRLADGSRVTKDTGPLTEKECEDLMLLELSKCVTNALTISPILSQYPEKLGAVASFIFNLGATQYRNSTLRRKINEGNFQDARVQISRWVYAGGRRLAGLAARRAEEAAYL